MLGTRRAKVPTAITFVNRNPTGQRQSVIKIQRASCRQIAADGDPIERAIAAGKSGACDRAASNRATEAG